MDKHHLTHDAPPDGTEVYACESAHHGRQRPWPFKGGTRVGTEIRRIGIYLDRRLRSYGTTVDPLRELFMRPSLPIQHMKAISARKSARTLFFFKIALDESHGQTPPHTPCPNAAFLLFLPNTVMRCVIAEILGRNRRQLGERSRRCHFPVVRFTCTAGSWKPARLSGPLTFDADGAHSFMPRTAAKSCQNKTAQQRKVVDLIIIA